MPRSATATKKHTRKKRIGRVDPNIAPDLHPFARPIKRFRRDPNNSRVHDKRNIESIKASLTQFGQTRPILVRSDGQIIAGNGTHKAAEELNWKRLAAVRFIGTEDEARAYAIADNRTAQLAGWELETLSGELKDLKSLGFNLEDLGWAPYESAPLLAGVWKPPAPTEGHTSTGPKVNFSNDQWRVVGRVISVLREKSREDGEPLSDGDALVEVCKEWIENHNVKIDIE